MYKFIALSLSLTLVGCAHTSESAKSDSGSPWWAFGSDNTAEAKTEADASVAKAPEVAPSPAAEKTAEAGKPVAPGKPVAANKAGAAAGKPVADAKVADAPKAPAPAAKAEPVAAPTETVAQAVKPADDGSRWWWPFPSKKAAVKKVVLVAPPVQVTQAWLDTYEPRVREAIKGSRFELERRENLLIVTAPVDGSFNPDRPGMLLPITLGPFSRVAKMVENDTDIAIIILGHADSSGATAGNRELSHERARAVTAIFRMSGLKTNRLRGQGVGSDMPRAANDSVQGRALNRRVEVLLTSPAMMQVLMAQYNRPATTQVVAAEQAK